MTALEYGYIEPTEENGKTHLWTAVGPKGGIHISARYVDDTRYRFADEQYVGGVEKHSKTPMYDWNADKPDHADCWLLKCPCWHDGSSSYFSRNIEPILRDQETPFPAHIHEYMNSIMHDWYRSHFDDRDAA